MDAGQICAEGLVNCPYNAFSASPEGTGNVALCIAQLKYRSILGGEAEHTFWYVLDSSQIQYIIDGGPSGSCSPDCGYLNDWVTTGVAPFGSTGIPADTTSGLSQ